MGDTVNKQQLSSYLYVIQGMELRLRYYLLILMFYQTSLVIDYATPYILWYQHKPTFQNNMSIQITSEMADDLYEKAGTLIPEDKCDITIEKYGHLLRPKTT